MGTWWLVRKKGSTEKWRISVRAFTQDKAYVLDSPEIVPAFN